MLNEIAQPHIASLAVYEPGRPIEEVARQLRLNPRSIIKLASNENPLGPSPKAVVAMKRALKDSHLYPDGSAFYLRQALAKNFKVAIENIVLGSGSNEIIEFLFHVFVGPGEEVVYSERSFAVYALCAAAFKAKSVVVPMKDHTHDLDAMLKACSGRTKLMLVTNPNNPTGTRVSNEALYRFLDRVPRHTVVAIDEAYFEFLDDAPKTIDYIAKRRMPNVILMRTFSKIAGLAALRIGYGIACPEMVTLLNKVRQPFNTNAIAQAGALAALQDRAHFERTRKLNRQGLAYLEAEFKKLKLEFIPSSGNFICVKVGDGPKVFDALQRRGVIVRPLVGYKMPEWLRVTVGTMPENRRFIRELKSIVGKS